MGRRMVSDAKLTWEERCERDRQRRIKIALELGDPAYVEYCRTMEYGTEAEDAEDARLSNEAAAATPDWRNQRDFNDELDEMYPEDARPLQPARRRFPRLGDAPVPIARATSRGGGVPPPARRATSQSRTVVPRVARRAAPRVNFQVRRSAEAQEPSNHLGNL